MAIHQRWPPLRSLVGATMASVGIRKRVSARTGRVTYQVWWLLDDGSQGAETVSSKDEARDLVAQKRLGSLVAPGRGSSVAGFRSAGGPSSGGRYGPPIRTAAPPPSL
jgi:hypothetical protein